MCRGCSCWKVNWPGSRKCRDASSRHFRKCLSMFVFGRRRFLASIRAPCGVFLKWTLYGLPQFEYINNEQNYVAAVQRAVDEKNGVNSRQHAPCWRSQSSLDSTRRFAFGPSPRSVHRGPGARVGGGPHNYHTIPVAQTYSASQFGARSKPVDI